MVEVINFNRIIGKTNCVSVDKTDTVVMAYRHGRKGPTPMVLNREPEDCSSLTVILKKDHNSGNYILITAFFGDSSEKEPWDPSIISGSEEHQKAKDFWATHALVYDPSTIAQMA
ncbi:MAG: hypothetical protein E7310_01010 [Clostridiales bacterium]|nr:hypothetical protein [Clostridiales bacterium]